MAHCGICFAIPIFVNWSTLLPVSHEEVIYPHPLNTFITGRGAYPKDTEEVEMPQNIEYMHSDIFSILAKEKELRGDGYRSKNLIDENLLERDEYLVRAPIRKSSSAHIGWHYKSIIWRIS